MAGFEKKQPIEPLAAKRILSVNEEELQRLVLDIHDGPVQQIFAALSQVHVLQNLRRRSDPIPDAEWDLHLTRISSLLTEAQREIREFISTFRPPDFPHRDLVELIRDLLLQHEAFTGCQVDLVVGRSPKAASFPTKIAFYRICQEALSNVYRHAKAGQVSVLLDQKQGVLILEIQDDGRGFAPPPLTGPDATEREEHIGLRGMRDRVGLIGGDFQLVSAPGKGTRVIVQVPANE